MFKRISILFMPLVIAACAGKAEPTSSAAPPAPTEVVATSPAPSPSPAVAAATEGAVDFVSECTLVSSLPEAPSEFAELFGVTAGDWVDGPETAALTIVEYGDFQ